MSAPEHITLPCPNCGRAMTRRTNHDNGSEFYGCTGWPDCTGTRPVPEYVRLREAGAAALPGFE